MARVHRTIDTRIFNPTESPVRREQAEDREGVSAWPTEPPRPTEPIPNPAGVGPSGAAGGPNRVMELGASRPNQLRTTPRL